MTAVFAHYTSEQLTQIHALEEQLTARGAIERRAMEDSEELSYDRVKFASLLAAHSRSDLARHIHVAMYSCAMWHYSGRSRDTWQVEVGTQSAPLDGSRAVEKRV